MAELCTICGNSFTPMYAFQIAVLPSPPGVPSQRHFFCAIECRQKALGEGGFATKKARRVAILNQKGGTGKTTTSINLAAGLAERGHSTLLIDMDAQGNVGVSLGIKGEFSLYHLLVEGKSPGDVAVPVRGNLDVITTDATLAVAEIWLARVEEHRNRILSKRLGNIHRRYSYILLDCGPSLSLLNQNALMYADEVLIPVSCDYLSLVGVKQVIKNIKDLEKHLGHSVRITGIIPTFYDGRVRLAKEAVETLQNHFQEKLFHPIRRSTRLAEAPSHRQTIFEYDPDSAGAEDYRKLVDRFIQTQSGLPLQSSLPHQIESEPVFEETQVS